MYAGIWTLDDWVLNSSLSARSLSDGRCHDSAEAAVASALKVGCIGVHVKLWVGPIPIGP